MDQTQIIKVFQDALTTIMLVAAPPLLLGMIVGRDCLHISGDHADQ